MKPLEEIVKSGKKALTTSLLIASAFLPNYSPAESIRITPEYNSQNIGFVSEIVPVKLTRNNSAGSYLESKPSTFYISGKVDKEKQIVTLALSTLKVPEELPINKPLTAAQNAMAIETIFDEINLNRTKVYVMHSLGTAIGETTQSAIIIPGERLELKPLEETLIPRLQLKYGEKIVNTVMEVLPKFCTTLREELEETERARTASKIRGEKEDVDSSLQITKIPLYPKEKGLAQKPEVRRIITIPYELSSPQDQVYIAINLQTGLGRPNEFQGKLEAIVEVEKTKGIPTRIPKKEKNEGIYGEWRVFEIKNEKLTEEKICFTKERVYSRGINAKYEFKNGEIELTIYDGNQSEKDAIYEEVAEDLYQMKWKDHKRKEVFLIREGADISPEKLFEKNTSNNEGVKPLKRDATKSLDTPNGGVIEERGKPIIYSPMTEQNVKTIENTAKALDRTFRSFFGRRK
jgi:hypothetical protein